MVTVRMLLQGTLKRGLFYPDRYSNKSGNYLISEKREGK